MIARFLSCVAALGAFSFSAGASAADLAEGQRLYQMHCAACHGVRGESLIPNAPNFTRGERLMQPDFQVMASVKAGKMAMPAFSGILRDQQILDIVAYLRTLQR